jgi:hypothetical protein
VDCKRQDDRPGMGCGGVKRNLPPIDYLITEAVLYRLDSVIAACRTSPDGSLAGGMYLELRSRA